MTLNNPCSLTSPLSVSLTFSSSQQEISTHHMLNPLPWNHCWAFGLCQPNFSTLPSMGVLQHLISVVYFFPVYLPKPKVFKFYVYCSVFQNLILFLRLMIFSYVYTLHFVYPLGLCNINHTGKLSWLFAVVEADYGKRRWGPLSQKSQCLFHIPFKSPCSESGWTLTL